MNILFGGKSPFQKEMTRHCHRTWEILAMLSGTGTIVFDDGEAAFDSYSVFCVPPGVSHRELSDTLYQDYWFQVSDFPLPEGTGLIHLQDGADRTVSSLMGLIYPLLYRRDSERVCFLLGHLTDALEELLLLKCHQRQPDIRVGQIQRIITQNMSNPDFRVEECLQKSGYCPDHIRRLFVREIGKTPREYLIDLRIRAAKRLLSLRHVHNDTVEQIAEDCGFSDLAYFSRVFKKRVGVSPTEYAAQAEDLPAPEE